MRSIRSLICLNAFLLLALSGAAIADTEHFSKKTYVYKKIDGHEIHADIYRGSGDEKQPAVIWIHGGALIFGTRQWLPDPQLQRYLKAGFTTIAIDHRLTPETKIPEIIDDIEDAYAWVREKGPELYNIDPDRIAIVGHSSGGYLTLVAGYKLNPRPKALVSFYGFGDLIGDWGMLPNEYFNKQPTVSKEDALSVVGTGPISNGQLNNQEKNRRNFFIYCKQNGRWPIEATGKDPRAEPEWFTPYEPLRNVDAKYPPTLFLHGGLDTDVPYEQTVMMMSALDAEGVPNSIIYYPEWLHLFDLKDKNDPKVQEAHDDVLQFLQRHL